MGCMKLLYTIAAEGCPHAGLSRALCHNALCVRDLLAFDAAGRPGFDAARDGYWPAMLRWREEQREEENA